MEIKNIVESAKDSKHLDAILLLYESKPKIQKQFAKLYQESFKWLDENDPKLDSIKKYASLVAEYVFTECISILSDDKKSDE